MQRWLLALDEPASNPCGNTAINHQSSSGTISTTALTVSAGNQNSSDNDGVKFALRLPNERYICNPDSLYAVPRTDLHEVEWIEPDSIDAEVSRFVAGSSTTTTTTTTTRNNPRRCYRTSTSSGYSSHSPPLSAGSYSCYASAVPRQGQGIFRALPITMKDQFGGGLAVIHESESIPRPIWPSAFPSPRELYQSDENPEYDAVYACCGRGCAYAYSYCDWDYENSTGISASARDVLLELSRTLNSVIEGETVMTPEEILHNISQKVAQGIGLKGGIYEYVYRNSSLLSAKTSFAGDKTSSLLSCNNRTLSTKINPVNSKLYSNMRQFYVHNPAWYTCLSSCEHTHGFLSSSSSSSKGGEPIGMNNEPGKKSSPPAVFLVDDHCRETTRTLLSESQIHRNLSGSRVCKCSNRSSHSIEQPRNAYTTHCAALDPKETIVINDETMQNRNRLVHNESEYATLECSDGGSSSEGIIVSSGKTNWDHRIRGFAGDLDFTLDVSRAERLGRTIAKAKRKRQWCRALTAFFGLVFFVLSVVIVSLSVTRGRKVFGSM
ncbi:uncharacterized protein LOC128890715 isoform X2 [Hylaeus anthracinus]|uniref:uncharacterized protein LOC128890715 isoform X2 n=1 Tax=Hylaeus anthracinus TaxID=313031 RepID=UPI0023BA132D|nr:uncharacterized protein LOC128890715 isoform X2 [Hylaeus anthracinus]